MYMISNCAGYTDEEGSYSVANKFCIELYLFIYYTESGKPDSDSQNYKLAFLKGMKIKIPPSQLLN